MRQVFTSSVFAISLLVSAASSVAHAAGPHFNDAPLWGPYRPNLYLGLRPRLPDSLLLGLMWANVDDYHKFQDLRHACEQGDDMAGYGWDQFDPRTGGRQIMHDVKMGLDLETIFIHTDCAKVGGWAIRVKGTPRDGAQAGLKTSLVFYAGLAGEGNIALDTSKPMQPHVIRGHTEDLGGYTITIIERPGRNVVPQFSHTYGQEKDIKRGSFAGVQAPTELLWQAKDILLGFIRDPILKLQERFGNENLPEPGLLFSLPNTISSDSNLYFMQKTFEGAFEFDIIFAPDNDIDLSSCTNVLADEIKLMDSKFASKFAKTFELHQPFDGSTYTELGKALFSNLMGGVGYFQGSSIVDRSYSSSYEEDSEFFWESASAQLASSTGVEEGPTELFTAVPSRAFFPRGFYWDEGFHLMLIGLWDQDISMEILRSWFDLMDEDGWIAREQILGAEARSKVPAEFTTQYPHYANPPTLFIALKQFLDRQRITVSGTQNYKAAFQGLAGDESAESMLDKAGIRETHNGSAPTEYLKSLYPNLKKHYQWFRTTQRGEVKGYDREAYSNKEAYRWRGRTPNHCLTSGLDDYPRAQPPHPGELHLDLHSWMGLMTRLMHDIAQELGHVEDSAEFLRLETGILRNLDDLHWDTDKQAYCDQSIDEYEENVAVCHLGYISIFPLILGLLPSDHPNLESVLRLMRDPDHLWSPYGLRSLSKLDPFYGTGEDYWRGPIWMNINYLALSSLYKNYINSPGPVQTLAKEIYHELRINVVSTVQQEYVRSGIFWEQYNPETGRGQRTKGFTGWTSLILNIMAEEY